MHNDSKLTELLKYFICLDVVFFIVKANEHGIQINQIKMNNVDNLEDLDLESRRSEINGH